MKTTTTRWESARATSAAMLMTLFVAGNVFGQTFDILKAKSSDKIAQSKLFMIDSAKVVNAFTMFAFDAPAERIPGDTIIVEKVQGSVSTRKEEKAISDNFSLDQNFPNPFNPSTTIRFHVRKTSKVSVVLFDATGREVCTLVDDTKGAGSYEIQWTGTDQNGFAVSSGTYFYRMIAASHDGTEVVSTRKMNFLK